MKHYLKGNGWQIIEDEWHPELNRISESIFSLGNGHLGLRGNFEESFSGNTMQGSYIAGVYYPDPTRVGWWKNGYPDYYAKVLNATNWIGIHIQIDSVALDIHLAERVLKFRRILDLQEGNLKREFTLIMPGGKKLQVETKRFCSIVDDDSAAIQFRLTPLNFSGKVSFNVFLDGDVKNTDSNFEGKFWDPVHQEGKGQEGYLLMETRKTRFRVCTGMQFDVMAGKDQLFPSTRQVMREKYISGEFDLEVQQDCTYTVNKYIINLSTVHYPENQLLSLCKDRVHYLSSEGFDTLLDEQRTAWIRKWEEMDIIIEGDVAAQQGIRFNIFQLHQTYTGRDTQLNIGPKGFTGEKYGGCTYWDTEAYCLPFFLGTDSPEVARNLLLYRYRQLDRAIENATKLGFSGGAALFPMATINGDECHNEWEITFEEIHRNGAIAYAIRNYCEYTKDPDYLADFGLEVLIAISRFWVQRVNWSEEKSRYVILGVTGPNEYENNVQNNWYTNTLAAWCLEFTREAVSRVCRENPEKFNALASRILFDLEKEMTGWKRVAALMHYPIDPTRDIFLQQDGYLDKEQLMAKDIPAEQLPLHQHWSWDRIQRSCFIKQADVLQGIYFFEERYDTGTIARNYRFYEPRTVHESSLSPCVHSILAARIGEREQAYELYLRTARLDLDNYNNDTRDGLHITSMAGTWMSIVQGFAGMRTQQDGLHFSPFIPTQWNAYDFNLVFREWRLNIRVDCHGVTLLNKGESDIMLHIFDQAVSIGPRLTKTITF
ncbi:MAG TPA: family 65 glycosyl hydrolase domain-containing protein [Chitinophagaceae bacterium]|nr:family 65 glycosyl hydrolase domain-containing protein [Chitinophagaceae bacterium]